MDRLRRSNGSHILWRFSKYGGPSVSLGQGIQFYNINKILLKY